MSMPKIDISTFRKRLDIQARTTTKDAAGGPVESWSTVAQCWAYVEPLSGREVEFARQVVSTASHRVTTRYYQGLRPNMRFLLDGTRVLDINNVNDCDELHQFMQCLCTEAS